MRWWDPQPPRGQGEAGRGPRPFECAQPPSTALTKHTLSAASHAAWGQPFTNINKKEKSYLRLWMEEVKGGAGCYHVEPLTQLEAATQAIDLAIHHYIHCTTTHSGYSNTTWLHTLVSQDYTTTYSGYRHYKTTWFCFTGLYTFLDSFFSFRLRITIATGSQ